MKNNEENEAYRALLTEKVAQHNALALNAAASAALEIDAMIPESDTESRFAHINSVTALMTTVRTHLELVFSAEAQIDVIGQIEDGE